MKAKYSLEGRIGDEFFLVQEKKGKFIEPPGSPTYYVRYTIEGKRRRKALGTNFASAVSQVQTLEIAKDLERRGIEMPADLAQSLQPEERLRDRIEDYLKEVQINKSRKTWLAYRSSLAYYFTKSCQRVSVHAITREDMLEFKAMLTQELSERSVYNNFLNVMVFLKWAGVRPCLRKGDWPPKPEREPEEYTDQEINALLEAANNEERLVLNSFLTTGLRSGELAHMTYGDVDFNHSTWTVKPKFGWKTKTRESQRTVPVPVWLNVKIAERMRTTGRAVCDLIFPNSQGNADGHLIRFVKRVSIRAGVGGRVDDHKFRSTAITRWLREGHPVPTVMKWVGHVDPNTLLRYAAKANLQDPEVHRKATAAFERFSGVGD